jgi:hypothetical protein
MAFFLSIAVERFKCRRQQKTAVSVILVTEFHRNLAHYYDELGRRQSVSGL